MQPMRGDDHVVPHPRGYRHTHPEFARGVACRRYVEGQNIAIEYRSADDQIERLPALAAELVRLPVDVIVTGGANAARVA